MVEDKRKYKRERGDALSLTEFRGYPVKSPEDLKKYSKQGSRRYERQDALYYSKILVQASVDGMR